LVADLTMPETLDSLLNYWIPMIIRSVGPIPLAIVGNKCDLEAKFGLAQLEKVAANCDYFGTIIPCYLTSAKTGENVEAAFTGLAGRIRAYSGMPVPEPEMSLDMKAADPLIDILDRIFVDFSEQFGGLEHSTPFIRQQMKLAGLDLDNPTSKSIETFIENLAAIESGHRPMKDVLANKKQRYGLFRNRLPGLYGI